MQEFIKTNQKNVAIVFIIGILVGALGLYTAKGFVNAELKETLEICRGESREEAAKIERAKILKKELAEAQDFVVENLTVSEIYNEEDGVYIMVSVQDIANEDEFATIERKLNITDETSFLKRVEIEKGGKIFKDFQQASIEDLNVGTKIEISLNIDLYINEEADVLDIRIVE